MLHEARSIGNSNDNISVFLHFDSEADQRQHNIPLGNKVCVILLGNGDQVEGMRDILLRYRGRGLRQINECHPTYLPLHYVILFPYGKLGWHPDMMHRQVESGGDKVQ